MNWKKTLNPWGYARDLEELFKRAVAEESKQKKEWIADYGTITIERDRLIIECSERKKEIITLTSQLEKANGVIDGLAQDNETLRIEAHGAENLIVELKARVRELEAVRQAPRPAVKVGAIPKAKAVEKRTATAPGGAKLVLKNANKANDDADQAYAQAVERKSK